MGEAGLQTTEAGAAVLSVAPMLDRTDRHFRFIIRQITRRTLLYTEMITTGALIQGDRDRHLGFDRQEKPLALQLGGDDPAVLARCARMAQDRGYDEVNLNAGCPSDRVRRGCFGAALMARPELVAESVAAMREAVSLPVTVKHRIGIDNRDRYEDMARFVDIVSKAGCDRFIVHARKAWLTGLSPKENRTVPPLRYCDVYRLKEEHPGLQIEINGGVTSLNQVARHLERVDGVMIGRAAYDDPYMLASADRRIFNDDSSKTPTRREVVERLIPYIECWRARDLPLHRITRHMMSIFSGCPGARKWRRHLGEEGVKPGAGVQVVVNALNHVNG